MKSPFVLGTCLSVSLTLVAQANPPGSARIVLVAAQEGGNKTIVRYPSAFAVSRPLSEMPIDEVGNQSGVLPVRPSPLSSHHGAPVQEDSVLQKEVLPAVGATKAFGFDGIGANGFDPSDSDIAVGPNHILEGVNVQLAVYSKTGTLLSGPTNFTTFFSALVGDPCALEASDPVMLYDRLADRWLVSDIGIGGNAGYAQCVGISKTNDPTGAYFLYSFSFARDLNDYPKLGVWPTTSNAAYLASYNIFERGETFIGADLCGMDRTKMLAGDSSAAQLCRLTPSNEGSYLPSDNDGPTAPSDGTPGLFLTWQNNNPGQLYLRKLTPSFIERIAYLSSATTISVANDSLACGGGGACVPQEGTSQTLDALGDRLMYRFPVRHFSDHDRATASHAVGGGGFRWYELFDPAGSVTLNQQGTFAPDSTYRWMTSMAEDQQGDIAVGYSASNSSIHPAIRFTGRVPSDPAGTLGTEASFLEGTGSQTGGDRWGDYTALQVDPTDDCTFWYVNQYEKTDGDNWSTHIGSFGFNKCTPSVSLSVYGLGFLTTPIGQTSPSKSVTLTNTGTATVNISSITISGDFIIQSNTCGSQVLAGANCKVTMAFTPTAKGVRHGTLTFNDNASNYQTVGLAGTGESLALTPNPVKYGTVTVGQSKKLAVTVTNVSTATVSTTDFTINGVAAADYSITGNTCGSTILAGGTCSISVKFAPTVKGIRRGRLNIYNNGGGGDSTDKLVGTGG